MPDYECFMIEPTDIVARELRRYVGTDRGKCPGRWGYHNASVEIDRLQKAQPRPGQAEPAVPVDLIPKDDPRWPKVCPACGYEFQSHDPYQVNDHRLYNNAVRGVLCKLSEAPVGAMWFTDWMANHGSKYWHERGGGPHLIVMTPAGEWDTDMPANNGDGWERSGIPPLVTAHPSIGIGNPYRYHGWLRHGKLVDA